MSSPNKRSPRSDRQELRQVAEPAGVTRGDASRARLVDAAIASVARHGLEGTTISRLMEFSGLSRGLISFHFDGKDKLLEAALEHAISQYEASWERTVIAPDLTPCQRLHAAVDHDIDFARAAPDVLSLWWAAWGEARSKSIYRRSSAARDERFVVDLARFFVKAGLAPKAAGRAAFVLNASLMGFWLQYHLDERASALEAAREAGHVLVDQLLPSPQRAQRKISKSR